MRVRSYSATAPRICGSADLQQQLGMWVLTHGPLQKLDAAAIPFPLVEEHHLRSTI